MSSKVSSEWDFLKDYQKEVLDAMAERQKKTRQEVAEDLIKRGIQQEFLKAAQSADPEIPYTSPNITHADFSDHNDTAHSGFTDHADCFWDPDAESNAVNSPTGVNTGLGSSVSTDNDGTSSIGGKIRDFAKYINDTISGAWTIQMRQGLKVQTLILRKSAFESLSEARKWVREHNFKTSKVDETSTSWRFRQFDPGRCQEGSFRSEKDFIKKGVTAVFCRPKA